MPGTAEVLLSVWVIDKSTWGVRVSVSVELLLAELVSDTPLKGETETVLEMDPVAVGSMLPERVMVTLFPEARFKPSQRPEELLYDPELGVPKVALSRAAGMESVNVKLLIVLGPLLVTVIVYVLEVPGVTEVLLSVCVTDKSTCGVRVSISVALLLDELVSDTPLGGETETMLEMDPVAVGSMVPSRVMVTLLPEARVKPFQTPEELL